MRHFAYLLAVFSIAIGLMDAVGQDKPTPPADKQPVRGPQYHLATAKTYNLQSHEHARILQKYAAADGMLPADVVLEHTSAIRYNMEGAKRAVNKLTKAEPDNVKLTKEVTQLQQRYDKLKSLLDKLEGQVAKDSIDQQTVISQTKAISRELQGVHTTYNTIDSNFYNSSSSSYYETGEGHFVD